ncbi:MAG: DUF58 domain-containing protein [Acidimicrobiales bacterium]
MGPAVGVRRTAGSRAAAPDALLRRLDWHVLRRLDGRLQGAHRSAFRGSGIDVHDLREYEPGDDVRHIDWNVTARLDTPFVREFHEDREITAWLLLDRSPSMLFGPPSRPKHVVLAQLAVSLGRLLGRAGNRVGAIIFDNTVETVLPPTTGPQQVLRLARELSSTPGGRGTATDLRVLLDAADAMIRRRSLVVLVSDLISEPAWEPSLGRLARRHDVVAVRLIDPLELALPDAGLLTFEDPETGERLVLDTSDPDLRRRLADEVDRRERALQAAVARTGVQLVDISTAEDPVDGLLRLVRARRLARAGLGRAGGAGRR